MQLTKGWNTAGSDSALWGKAGTYKRIAYEALPKLDGLDGSFAWLLAATPMTPYGMVFGAEDETPPPVGETIATRVAEAERAGLVVPDTFVKFMNDESLTSLVPSCTACYYDIGARLVPVPGHDEPARLLRFMNDQQCCCCWYLLLEPGGGHKVAVASPRFIDGARGDSLEDVAEPADVIECAASFEEFIKRFWIENALWFGVNAGKPLSEELRAYAASARKAVESGLVSDERA